MILFRLARAQWPRVAAGLLAVAALVAACGGSTTQYEPFIAERVFAFGDETSVLTASPAGNGLKYSINGLDGDGNVDCRLNPIWVQSVAALYGFVAAECNPNGLEPKATIFAEAGAKVDDVIRQVERAALLVDRRFGDKDLATVLAGANDILELYARYPAESPDALLAQARSRGVQLARAVNALVALGARVVVSDLPSLGLTPFARKEKALHTDTDRAALLTDLSTAFNEQLGVNILLDGRYIGLVQADLQFRAISDNPGTLNVTEGACTAALPLCNTATLVPGASAFTHLWADDTRLSGFGQSQLATLAIDRASRNPF
ncbi:MAG: SGNH/GDSL hydrolase family protein [Rubrivivax sp.]|nr:SGNH/GDSL hydrolase family protein [Rubrivivax sp.]